MFPDNVLLPRTFSFGPPHPTFISPLLPQRTLSHCPSSLPYLCFPNFLLRFSGNKSSGRIHRCAPVVGSGTASTAASPLWRNTHPLAVSISLAITFTS